MAFLTANNGSQVGRRHELSRGRYVLGRHPECDIVVDAGAVSRHHAQLLRVGEDFFVEDMNSRNGTFVNDRMILGRQRLDEGDKIRVCDISFTFHTSERPPGESSSIAVLVDDANERNPSTIMSKLDVSSDDGSLRFSATADAKLQALIDITRSLGNTLALDQVLPGVLNSLFKIFLQADRGFIVLQDDEGQLVPRWTKLRRDSSTETIRISRTIVREVMNSKQAILSADAVNDQRFEMSQSIADFRIRSMICAPLVNVEGKAIGVLQVDTTDQRNRFRVEDLEVLCSIASQATVAIENAQLHESLLNQRELERDLQLARDVQKGFLPFHPPVMESYGFYDFYEPANEIGGDYYDYIFLPDGRLAIVVADVVGHGIAAALMMVQLRASVRFSFESGTPPDVALTKLNKSLAQEDNEGRFITLVMVILDPRTHDLTIVNAGHMPPLVRHPNGQLDQLGEKLSGLPLLIDSDYQYKVATGRLKKGDAILLFTDGLTEAMNERDELYGMERMHRCVSTSEPAQLGDNLIRDVQQFIGARPAKDDMCFVCCQRIA